MKIFIIRHPHSIANEEKIYNSFTDVPLSGKGAKQMEEVIQYLKNIKNVEFGQVQSIYSSPLTRCTNIADTLAKEWNCPIIKDDKLVEMNFGIFEGKTYQEIDLTFPNELLQWSNDYIHYQIPEGESLQQCMFRIEPFVNRLKNQDQDVAIVTHGGIVKLLMLSFLDLPIETFWKFATDNCCIVEINYVNNYGYLSNLLNFSS
ncbi:alpha-ribazole phosphatase [Bacillus sp. RG28]|uniref:Alpha-ribazole phosphatase n=1 Tax=Gottfriedia endophytica TaxID=2820819 RepID=A0A940NKZ1_9BACI|nr:alpha-ribazole phosphatase [Gottfriedia endophytica]MBP0724446.1 alpha-ribazole phosphatase [Gottfriedia endophytica]